MAIGYSLNDLIEYYERNNFDKDCEIRVANSLTQNFEPKYCHEASAQIKDFRIVPSVGGVKDAHQGVGSNFFVIIIDDEVSTDQTEADITDQIQNDGFGSRKIQILKEETEKEIKELQERLAKYELKIQHFEMIKENQTKNW